MSEHLKSQVSDLQWNILQAEKQIEACKRSIAVWERSLRDLRGRLERAEIEARTLQDG